MNKTILIQNALDAKASCELLLKKALPAKTIFKLISLDKALTSIEQDFLEAKYRTILKYGKKNESGEVITEQLENGQTYVPIELEFQSICTKEITEALLQEVDCPNIIINIDELGNEILIGKDLIGLYPFLSE